MPCMTYYQICMNKELLRHLRFSRSILYFVPLYENDSRITLPPRNTPGDFLFVDSS